MIEPFSGSLMSDEPDAYAGGIGRAGRTGHIAHAGCVGRTGPTGCSRRRPRGKHPPHRPSRDRQVGQHAEIGKHQRTHGERAEAAERTRARLSGGASDAALQPEARHAAAGADAALREVCRCTVMRGEVVGLRHRHALDVVQIAVVALEDQRIDRGQASAAFGIRADALPDLRGRHGGHRERVGQRNRCFQHAELFDLQQPGAFSEAVEHRDAGRHALQERIAAVRPQHGDAGVDVALVERGMSHGDTRHIGDRIARAGLQAPDVGNRRRARHLVPIRAGRSSGRAHRAVRRPAG